jgi:hypothetical protein
MEGTMASEKPMTMARSRYFSFQIQFRRGVPADHGVIDKVVCVVREGGGNIGEQSISEEGGEVVATINAEVADADLFWRSTKSKLLAASRGAHLKGMIVVCEGERGWDDYLLLRHFDKSQKIDRLGHNG